MSLMKGTAGRATRSSSDKPKRPEDVPKTLPRKSIPKVIEEEEDEELEESPQKAVVSSEKEKKRVVFDVPSKPSEQPKKPSSVPYVMVPPLKSPEKVKPRPREEHIPQARVLHVIPSKPRRPARWRLKW